MHSYDDYRELLRATTLVQVREKAVGPLPLPSKSGADEGWAKQRQDILRLFFKQCAAVLEAMRATHCIKQRIASQAVLEAMRATR